MEPSVKADQLPASVVGDGNGFIQMDESNGGIFAAGVAGEALDVNRAVQNATGSALRAIQVINRVSSTED
jgi:quinone-modifying oxidoreductase subunit QmoA